MTLPNAFGSTPFPFIRLCLWVSLLTVLTVPARLLAQVRRPITIGVITDLSGPASYYGQQTRVGTELAQRDFHAQGLPVSVIVEDSALNTQRGLSAAQKLLMVDKVEALYVDFTVIARAVSPLVQTQKRLMIYSAAAQSVAKSNPYAFKTYSDYAQGCEALTQEFLNRGIRTLGVLHTEAEYGDLCLEGVRRAVPQVAEQSYKQGESVSSQVLALKNKGVQAIINASFEGDIRNMLKAAYELGLKARFGVPEDTMTAEVLAKFHADLEESMTFGLKGPPPALLERTKGIAGADQLPGEEGVGIAYLHIHQLHQALNQCPPGDSSCAVAALAQADPDWGIGFGGWEQRSALLETVVKEIKDGKLVPIGSYLAGKSTAHILSKTTANSSP